MIKLSRLYKKAFYIINIVLLISILFCSCSSNDNVVNADDVENTTPFSKVEKTEETEPVSQTSEENYPDNFIVPPDLSKTHKWKSYYEEEKNDDLCENENTGKLDLKVMCLYYLASYLGQYEITGTYENFDYTIHDSGFVSIDNYNGIAIKVNIPEEIDGHKVAYIGEDCFRHQVLLREINLPGSIVLIESGAFFNCMSLREINLPEGLLYIGNNAFYGAGLRSLNLPDSVLAINTFAFEGCQHLKTAHLSEFLQYTAGYTFSGCSSLESVNIPDTLDSISIGMFQGCAKLKEINFPKSLKSIESHSFVGCISLKKIKLPKDVVFYEEYGAAFNSDVEIEYY